MRSLRRVYNSGLILLVICSISAIVSIFLFAYQILENNSLIKDWNNSLDIFYSSSNISDNLKHLTVLASKTDQIWFVNQDDLNRFKESFASFKNSPQNKKDAFEVLISVQSLYNYSNRMILFVMFFITGLLTIVMIIGYSHVYIFAQRKVFRFLDDLSKELRDLDFGSFIKKTRPPFTEMNELVNAFNDLAGRFKNYKMVLDLANSSKTIEDLTSSLNKDLKNLISFNRISYAKVEKEKVINVTTYSDSENVLIKPYFEWKISDSSFRDILKIHEPIVINDYEKHLETHPNSQTIKALIDEGVQSSIALPIFSEDKNLGFLFLDSFEKNAFTKANVEMLKTLQILISLAYNKTSLTSDLLLQTVTGFSKLVESKDNETGFHLERMALYSRSIAEAMFNTHWFKEIDTQFVNHIYFEAPLHDIGKVGIPDRILLKPAKLDPEEFEIMKTHTTIGYDILKEINEKMREHGMNVFEMGIEIARHHHERWDGTGYPDKLKGENIPLCARIVAVADVFDALTTKRPYKTPFDYDLSVKMITEESGTHFDPKVVEAFIKAQENIKEIYEQFKET